MEGTTIGAHSKNPYDGTICLAIIAAAVLDEHPLTAVISQQRMIYREPAGINSPTTIAPLLPTPVFLYALLEQALYPASRGMRESDTDNSQFFSICHFQRERLISTSPARRDYSQKIKSLRCVAVSEEDAID